MTKRHAQNPLTLKLLNLFGQFTISTSLQLCKFLAMLEAHSCSFEAWTLFQDGFPILWPTFDQFVTNIWPILWPTLWMVFAPRWLPFSPVPRSSIVGTFVRRLRLRLFLHQFTSQFSSVYQSICQFLSVYQSICQFSTHWSWNKDAWLFQTCTHCLMCGLIVAYLYLELGA